MQRFCLTFIFVIFSIIGCKAQFPTFLKKYSYPVFSFSPLPDQKINISIGTAFFYKGKNKTFLVSNYHVFTQMDPFTKTLKYKIDGLYFRYKTNAGKYDTIVIPISSVSPIKFFQIDEDMDLYGIELPRIPKMKLNYINVLIDRAYFDKIPEEVYYYGFPDDGSNSQDYFYAKVDSLNGRYDKTFIKYERIIKINFPNYPAERLNYIVNVFKQEYFLLSKVAKGGFSGSPAFGKFINNKKIVYKFVGIVFGYEGHLKQTWAIQAKACSKYFKDHFY